MEDILSDANTAMITVRQHLVKIKSAEDYGSGDPNTIRVQHFLGVSGYVRNVRIENDSKKKEYSNSYS